MIMTLRPVSVVFCLKKKKEKKEVVGISSRPELKLTVLDKWVHIGGGLWKEWASVLQMWSNVFCNIGCV